MSRSANDRQVGGSHYASAFQHWDMVDDYGVGYLEGCATKYVARWRKKFGLQDLEKAAHFTEKLLENIKTKGRKPYGLVPADVVARFNEENKLDAVESMVIYRLCTWEELEDVEEALRGIRSLIASVPVVVTQDQSL